MIEPPLMANPVTLLSVRLLIFVVTPTVLLKVMVPGPVNVKSPLFAPLVPLMTPDKVKLSAAAKVEIVSAEP